VLLLLWFDELSGWSLVFEMQRQKQGPGVARSVIGQGWGPTRSELQCGAERMRRLGLVLSAIEVGFDFGYGVEALRHEVGIWNFDVEFFFEAGDEVRQRERIESAGVEEALVGAGVIGDVGDCMNDFENSCLGAHGFICLDFLAILHLRAFVTACVAFDSRAFIWSLPQRGCR
jgi:hypothetical protein